ncbi:hypothetical protein C8R47DRAFT_732240 [Mycena vitilis]|nr:hypothetical protein C8R47DRAFT_732240 [Mycena vitilis]
MLASLKSISSFQNRKKVSSKSPFSLKRPDPASPHPYATPTPVFDIGESSYEELVPDAASSSRIHDSTPIHLAEPIASPRVEVDIDVTPADWFPSHFLRTDSVAAPRSLAGAAAVIAESSTASKSVDTLQTDDLSDDEDEDTSTTSEDDVVSNLEAMDASNFVNLPVPTSDGLMAQSTDSPVMGPRKGAGKGVPAPIKIPNASLHGPRVQIVRSSTAQSRPDSMFSFDGTSAVSGTTLARALIGDTYVLSGDRSSKYRSGASVLTRSDSATLPRGEHPFSPAWSIRKSGAFTPVDGMGVAIPPVPQMPEELRRVIAESRDRLKVDEAGERRRSRRRSGSDVETPVTPLVRTNSGSRISGSSSDDARLEKRVSRISEAPTPISAALLTPDLPSATDSAAGNTDPSPNTSSFHAGGASPSSFPTSPGQSSTAASGRYSQDIDNVLDYYNFEPSPGYSGGASSSAFDLPSPDIPADPNRYHPAFSPITEESGSQLSPNSFRSRRTNGKLSLASTPSPSTGGGRVEWRQGELRSLPLHPLLPIGDRPRSASVTPSPIIIPGPPLLTASNSYPSLPSPPSPTHETLEPPSRSFFNRQRSGSAPSPIQVIRDPRDFNAYNITVTPARFSTSSNSSTPVSPESENVLVRQQQTFPETPSAFSPTFSPETAANRNSMIPPPVPAVAGAVPRAGFGSLAQQMLLTRAATTVRGARHSRQASMTRARNRSTAIFPSAQTANMLKEALVENGVVSPDDETGPGVDSLVQEKVEEEEEAERDDEDATPRADEEQLKSSEAGHGAPSSPPISEESASVYSPSVRSFSSPPQQSRSIHRLSNRLRRRHFRGHPDLQCHPLHPNHSNHSLLHGVPPSSPLIHLPLPSIRKKRPPPLARPPRLLLQRSPSL